MALERKKLINLIIAIILALIAVFLVNAFLTQQAEEARKKAQASRPDERYEVVVTAVRQIPRGQIIDKNMITLKKVPVNFIQPGATASPGEVLGKMALVDILPDEQISTTKLTSGESGMGVASVTLSMKTPSGKRAITIPMDRISAVGGMISPGDYVDVIGNFPIPQMIAGRQEVQLVTVTLFQNVLVLAVGSQIHRVSDKEGGGGDASTITLALSPQEAELISFAQEQGKLKLILRPPLDTAYHPLPVATWDALLQHILKTQGLQAPTTVEPEEIEAPPPPPPPVKAKGPQVEIFRGQEKERVEIEK